MELEELLFINIGSCSGVVEIDNDFSAILLSWVSDMSKSTFPISLDERETLATVKNIGSLTFRDKNGESRSCSRSAGISCRWFFSGCEFLVQSAGFFLNIFFLAVGSFLAVGAFLLTPA